MRYTPKYGGYHGKYQRALKQRFRSVYQEWQQALTPA